jgi:hypothetical protein
LLSTKTTPQQIDAWRGARSETEHLEFKEARTQYDFHKLLAYCVAIANERGGRLLLGIMNRPPRPVVGTNAFLNIEATKTDILNKLRFRVDIEEITHPDGRVLVFHIPSRPIGHPYELDGSYYMRSGESVVAMTPDQIKQILKEEKSRPYRKFVVGGLLLIVVGVFSFMYWEAVHKPRQRDTEVGPLETHQATDKITAVVTRDWHDKHNWRSYLHTGMTRKQVRSLFGDPETIHVNSTLESWEYGSGEITFLVEADSPDGSLYSWFEPDSDRAQSSIPPKNKRVLVRQRPYDLTGDRRKKFLELLGKPQSEPRDTLRMGCISWSDAACVAAGKFLILFSEAGWTIDSNRVFRLEPQIPIDGMAIVSRVDNLTEEQKKLPPHLGTWQKMDASQVTIYWAFRTMGIPVSSSSDPSLPVGTLGIYFGPEPQ